MAEKKGAKKMKPSQDTSEKIYRISGKKNNNQLIIIAVVAIVALAFFGYVYFKSSKNSEAKEHRGSEVTQDKGRGEDMRDNHLSGSPWPTRTESRMPRPSRAQDKLTGTPPAHPSFKPESGAAQNRNR